MTTIERGRLDIRFNQLSQYDQDIEVRQLINLACQENYREFLSLPPGQTSTDGSAIVGRAGYLFVNDGSNAWKDQLSGSQCISDDTLAAINQVIMDTMTRCNERGISFRLLIYPEKDIIYPELSPNVADTVYNGRPVNKITELLQGIVVYPALEMIREKIYTQQFHCRNSHVCFYGGLVVTNIMLDSIGMEPIGYDQIKTDIINWPDDLSMKWVDGFITSRRRVFPYFQRETIYAPENGHVGTRVATYNENATVKNTVVVFGDSYAWNQDAGLIVFLALRFERVYFVWGKQVDWDLVSHLNPSVLILETAERFLIRGIK